ncbi:MAG: recombinase family protein [Lachnospiraceae bacterium]|nr:recombinase family protein [Lachnospiraceae bacterium]
MIPAIEYTRASTDQQEYSVGDQHKFNLDWAKRNNYKIIKTYSDDGISGGSLSHARGSDGRKPRYRCNNNINGARCKNLSVKIEYVENLIFDTLEEYRENKVRLTDAIDQLETRRYSVEKPAFDPATFQEKCLSALSLLQSDISMEQKTATSHALIEKIMCDNVKKEITIYFYA